jgi:hypothetical protein
MAIGNFSKLPAKGAAGARPVPARKSRYAGLKAMAPRDPMPREGEYRFEVVSCEEGYNKGTGNESFKAHLLVKECEGEEANNGGDRVVFIQLITGKSGEFGLGRVKSFVMAAAGYADEAEYDSYDPDGEFIDACVGKMNAYSARGDTIVGRSVLCRVSRGKATPDGADYYREFEWAAVEAQ